MPRPIRIKYTIPVGAQFGAPRGNGTRIHQGCDYHCPVGTPIYGTSDGGKVIYIGYNGDPITGSGNNVVIQYGNRITTDMHLRERTPLHVGSIVNHDTIVGHVGTTGNAVNADPPGSHDHHQMTLDGKLINPETFYGTEPASLDPTPIDLTRKNDTMLLKYDTNGAGYLFTDNGYTVLTAQEWELFKRLKRANEEGDFANPKTDPFLAGEMAIIAGAVKRTATPVDVAAIAASLVSALPSGVTESTPDEIAAAVIKATAAQYSK